MSDLLLHVRRTPLSEDAYDRLYDYFIAPEQGPRYINVDESFYEPAAPEREVKDFLRWLEREGLGTAGPDQSFILLPEARHKALGPQYPAFRYVVRKLLEVTQEQFEEGQPFFREALRSLENTVADPARFIILFEDVDGLHRLRFQEFLRLAAPGTPYYICLAVETYSS